MTDSWRGADAEDADLLAEWLAGPGARPTDEDRERRRTQVESHDWQVRYICRRCRYSTRDPGAVLAGCHQPLAAGRHDV